MSRRLSLTPPECYGMYPSDEAGSLYTATQYVNETSPSRHDIYGLNQHYLAQTSTFGNPFFAKSASGKEDQHQATRGWMASGSRASAGLRLPNVPMLTSVHQPEPASVGVRQPQQEAVHVAAPAKEEVATGGVAAHLDYEMDAMAGFVAEMAQGMYDLYESRICLADIDMIRSVNPKASVAPAFGKYVLQVLSSTRLPSSTILMGLYYLATRMSLLSSGGRYPTARGRVYHMLTVALLLGSKFLDDNTFQNRSWSEVSNIPVKELNDLELDWLLSIDWKMHSDPEDPQGLSLWLSHWKRWQAKRFQPSSDPLVLHALDANIQRLPRASNVPNSPAFTRQLTRCNGLCDNAGCENSDMPRWRGTRCNPWSSTSSRTDYSPPSAPETGPTTPEYYGQVSDSGFARSIQPPSAQAIQIDTQLSYPSFQHAPYSISHPQSYVNQIWNRHLVTCSCMSCVPYTERYHNAPAYGLQPVMG
ncbi:MAG: hypothetical protein Q9183_000417 [Haloplaca sp. 2 TL-2023]